MTGRGRARAAALVAGLAAAAACSEISESDGIIALAVAVPTDLALEIGETAALAAWGLTSEGDSVGTDVTWVAADTTVGVDAVGVVTALFPGSGRVQAQTGPIVSDLITFTVTATPDTLIVRASTKRSGFCAFNDMGITPSVPISPPIIIRRAPVDFRAPITIITPRSVGSSVFPITVQPYLLLHIRRAQLLFRRSPLHHGRPAPSRPRLVCFAHNRIAAAHGIPASKAAFVYPTWDRMTTFSNGGDAAASGAPGRRPFGKLLYASLRPNDPEDLLHLPGDRYKSVDDIDGRPLTPRD